MNIYKKIAGSLFSVFLVLLFFTNACEIGNPTEGLEVRIATISRTNTVSVEIIDAATQKLVKVPVQITFEGDGKEDIISSTNTPITNMNSDEGIAVFSVKDEISPSETEPFKVTLVCTAENYINTSQPVRLTKTGSKNISIFMTNKNDLPDGTASETQDSGTSDATTGTSGNITASSGTESTSGGQATVSLPQGTRLLDENGNSLTGDVRTTVTYFNPTDEESVSSFPGGFSVDVENESGEMQEGAFVTAGFVAVDMTVDGTPVETFEGGTLQLDIDIPEGIINPNTNEVVAVGDTIPLWSYNEENGEWKYEGDVVVSGGGKTSSGLKASFKNIPHLSYWNLDWFLFGNQWCTYGVTIKFVSTTGCFEEARGKMFYESVTGSGNFDRQATVWYNPIIRANDPYRTFEYVPPDKPFKVEVWSLDYSQKLGETIIDNLCAAGTLDVAFTPSNDNILPVTLAVHVVCDSQSDNPRVITVNGNPLYAQKVDIDGNPLGDWFYIGSFVNGVLPTICLETNQYYIFKMEYDGDWYNSLEYEPPFLINDTDILYQIIDDNRICDNF